MLNFQAPKKNLPFERRYPRETVERIRAVLRETICDSDPLPSYRAVSRYLADYFGVSVSSVTVKRLMARESKTSKG